MNNIYLAKNCNRTDFLLWLGIAVKKIDSGSKTTKELFAEYQDGESKFYKKNNEIYREVHVVKLVVKHPFEDKVLIEVEQYLPGQQEPRKRNICPSEKCKGDEKPLEAAIRGLKEELLFEKNYQISFDHDYVEEKDSFSYQGLKTSYYIYVFNVAIEETLIKPEYTIQEDDGKVSIFTWQNANEQ